MHCAGGRIFWWLKSILSSNILFFHQQGIFPPARHFSTHRASFHPTEKSKAPSGEIHRHPILTRGESIILSSLCMTASDKDTSYCLSHNDIRSVVHVGHGIGRQASHSNRVVVGMGFCQSKVFLKKSINMSLLIMSDNGTQPIPCQCTYLISTVLPVTDMYSLSHSLIWSIRSSISPAFPYHFSQRARKKNRPRWNA